MNIRAICTDIDGTLLNKDREISQRTIQAIQSLPKDFPIILASSRMPSAMIHLQKVLDRIENPLICYNGGYVVHYLSADRQILGDVCIPLDICEKIQNLSKGTAIHVSLYGRDDWFAPRMDFWTKREIRNTKVSPSIQPFTSVIDHWNDKGCGAHKVMCMGPAEEIQALFDQLTDTISQEVHLYRSKDTYIEIAPKKISKASALKDVLSFNYDIDMSEVMAFGDNYNDMDLLQAVGHGVAVGNARPEVKAVANEITTPSIEDGVAEMIEKYCLS
ncbi:HAD family phosphatase [Litoribacter ruber]|uniref:HAD family phosphatase n=1 Tax=Litoribacter ruber TaxID=702568 RepID=A0AAP2CG49_9BACT|nr:MULTISPECIES: Cof-type HAD-IIB family hydrolase [Litoribacter]MBS9522551.1 HAD family phosphatase [Litoribacter alkaliphilus]MBT0811082.1 HAD family phosphatase [Litoribacter ruber]